MPCSGLLINDGSGVKPGHTNEMNAKTVEEVSSLTPRVGKGTRIFPGAQISPLASIGTDCKISSGAKIGICKIGNNVYIGTKAELYSGVEIGDYSRIEKYVKIYPGVKLGYGVIVETRAQIKKNLNNNDKVGANSIYG